MAPFSTAARTRLRLVLHTQTSLVEDSTIPGFAGVSQYVRSHLIPKLKEISARASKNNPTNMLTANR